MVTAYSIIVFWWYLCCDYRHALFRSTKCNFEEWKCFSILFTTYKSSSISSFWSSRRQKIINLEIFILINSNVCSCHSGVIYCTSLFYTSAGKTLSNIKWFQVAYVKVSSIAYRYRLSKTCYFHDLNIREISPNFTLG